MAIGVGECSGENWWNRDIQSKEVNMKRKLALLGSLLVLGCLSAPGVARTEDNGHNVISEAANTISDAALTTKVKAVLETNKVAREYKVHVHSNQGAVTLTGHVGSPKNANYIASVVRNVSGVKEVHNELMTP